MTPGPLAWSDLRAVITHIGKPISWQALLAVLAAVLVPLIPGLAKAQDAPRVCAPEGQQVVAFAWAGEASLDVVTQGEGGYNVYRVELADSKWLPVAMPPSFTRLKPAVKGSVAVDFALADNGAGLAVLEHAPEPLITPTLSVYRWTDNGYRGVDTRQIPPDFWPAHMAWDTQGQILYLAAREYLFPDQLYSIGALELASGQYSNVMLKGNIDLVDELAFVPQRQALAVMCRGFQGEYPQQSVAALIELASKQFFVLHSEADGHQLRALANGQLLVTGPVQSTTQVPDEVWLLESNSQQLVPAQSLPATPDTLQASGNGRWLGYISSGQEGKLTLLRTHDGQTLATELPCSLFAFSRNSGYVCALDQVRECFTFYQLPAD